MWYLLVVACSLILLANSSKCPESRKPHLTSCTIFYNCVNLPGGGYVWVPSKCTDGLVFQPYLRMCVVPGDIWTCDTLSTDSTFVTKKYETPELIDPTDTSYLGYTQAPVDFSETIDSSYVIEDDTPDLTTETATPYPLIEFSEMTYSDEGGRNVSRYKGENHSYEYMNTRRRPLPLTQKYEDLVNDRYKWLNTLMSRLYVYKELSAALSDSLLVLARDSTTVNPTRTITILATHNQKQNISLNYLVQSYIEGNNKLYNDKPTEMTTSGAFQGDNVATTSTESTLQLLIDGLDSDNNIIMINDHVGNKQYFTIDKYKAIAGRLPPRSVAVVACVRNIRLPNRTDCERYYMCDPKTAVVVEYSCPLHTAFNAHLRICDVESSRTCRNDEYQPNETLVERVVERENISSYDEKSEEKLCREFGKMKDPTSEFHYHICYSMPGSEEIKSIRMTCPNALIFCQEKRVCTIRRLCNMMR